MSNTPKTDALFFPYGRDHTAAASPSFLTCWTEYELLEKENAALRVKLEKKEWVGLTGTEINHIFAKNVGYPERMMKDVENLLKEKNT